MMNKNDTMLNGYRDVLTVKELADVLRIGKNSAYALVKKGAVASIRIGSRYLVPKCCIFDFLGALGDNHLVD